MNHPLTKQEAIAALRAAGKAVETTNLQGLPPATAFLIGVYAAVAELEKDGRQ